MSKKVRVEVVEDFNAVDDKKTTSKIDFLEDLKVSSALKKEIKDEVGEFILEETRTAIGTLKSPVQGQKWKATLSPKYKNAKAKTGARTVADLTLQGDLLESLGYKTTKNGVEIGHFNKKQGLKADGHNNFSGKSKIETRRYLPKKGQSYKAGITRGIKDIVASKLVETTEIPKAAFRLVENKTQFDRLLRATFPDLTRAEIINSISENEEWTTFFLVSNLLRFING